MKDTTFSDVQLNSMPIDVLVNYILDTYHTYIREKGPRLRRQLAEVTARHGQYHPTLFEVTELFEVSMLDLEHHLQKEEQVLFPYIMRMAYTDSHHEPLAPFHCGSVANPIEVMRMEHDSESTRYNHIADLTGGFTAPGDASEDYLKVYEMLSDFNYMLREHIHVENDILFPRAIELEARLREATA